MYDETDSVDDDDNSFRDTGDSSCFQTAMTSDSGTQSTATTHTLGVSVSGIACMINLK